MRALAEELSGTGAASLYWHVGSKDGLLDLVFDESSASGRYPTPIRRAGASSSRRSPALSAGRACATRTSCGISIGRIPMGPNALRYSERVLAIMRAGGMPPRLAVQGYLRADLRRERLHHGRDRGRRGRRRPADRRTRAA